MTTSAQKKANAAYRSRLAERGLVRLEVVVPEKDRDRIKAFAEQLTSASDIEAAAERSETVPVMTGRQIWESLRKAPFAASGIEIERADFEPRAVEF